MRFNRERAQSNGISGLHFTAFDIATIVVRAVCGSQSLTKSCLLKRFPTRRAVEKSQGPTRNLPILSTDHHRACVHRKDLSDVDPIDHFNIREEVRWNTKIVGNGV